MMTGVVDFLLKGYILLGLLGRTCLLDNLLSALVGLVTPDGPQFHDMSD